jgi:hypothetical protein
MKVFHNKQKLKEYMTTSHHYRKLCKKFYTQMLKTSKTMRGWKLLNLRRTDKYAESSIESVTHTQILKQQNK